MTGRESLGTGALSRLRINHQIATASEADPVIAKGKVKFFNETKGYGFFTRDDGSGDVFVHRTDLPADVGLIYEGQPVSFEIEMTARGLRAINIAMG